MHVVRDPTDSANSQPTPDELAAPYFAAQKDLAEKAAGAIASLVDMQAKLFMLHAAIRKTLDEANQAVARVLSAQQLVASLKIEADKKNAAGQTGAQEGAPS
jgi:hypothetical protein